jgi:hypothetical protein
MIETHIRSQLIIMHPIKSLKPPLLAVLIGSLLIASTQTNLYSEEITRDLSKYKNIGPYVLGYTPELRKGFAEKQADIRELLWGAFRKHELAHVIVTIYSREGDKTVSSFFVEPDEDGRWCIQENLDRDMFDRNPEHRNRIQEHQRNTAYYLKRIDINSEYDKRQYLPDSANVTGHQYELELIDKDHKKITEF